MNAARSTRKQVHGEFYALFHGRFIVTANEDGSVPLNATLIAEISMQVTPHHDLLNQLIADANECAKRRKEA